MGRWCEGWGALRDVSDCCLSGAGRGAATSFSSPASSGTDSSEIPHILHLRGENAMRVDLSEASQGMRTTHDEGVRPTCRRSTLTKQSDNTSASTTREPEARAAPRQQAAKQLPFPRSFVKKKKKCPRYKLSKRSSSQEKHVHPLATKPPPAPVPLPALPPIPPPPSPLPTPPYPSSSHPPHFQSPPPPSRPANSHHSKLPHLPPSKPAEPASPKPSARQGRLNRMSPIGPWRGRR